MTVPTTTAVAIRGPSPRISPGDEEDGVFMGTQSTPRRCQRKSPASFGHENPSKQEHGMVTIQGIEGKEAIERCAFRELGLRGNIQLWTCAPAALDLRELSSASGLGPLWVLLCLPLLSRGE